ncbi:FMN-binding protein [Pseudarthrobacter sp. NPDC092419]|uniref:FMN-binding protein n=1 Tax=Pseudarthrobacter sp. NPDC092419 TaxID=3364414 RepID=UPI003811CCFE
MRPSVRKTLFAGVAGLSLAGTVAACAPAANNTTPPDAATGSPGTTAAPSAASPGTYKDGTYSADGNYVSPNGTETVGVQLTLASGTVTDVKITEHPTSPNTRKFQGEFAGGIADQVVGKNVDDLNISKVAGSSLTSGGFNQALERIKAQAQ